MVENTYVTYHTAAKSLVVNGKSSKSSTDSRKLSNSASERSLDKDGVHRSDGVYNMPYATALLDAALEALK